jgi:NAD(P)-dependent dehydrogenase (short-subunit alcohol dehydrogenase family)
MGRDLQLLWDRARHLMEEHAVEVLPVRCDVTDPESVREAFACSRERYPTPWGLVNNAGHGESAPFVEIDRGHWDRMLAVNLTGAFLCTQEVLPAMLAAGAGRVVNVASTAGLKGYARLAGYVASKHGLVGLTRALALETARDGITVNAVCPGYTDTDLAREAIANIVRTTGKSEVEAHRLVVRHNPRGTLIRPEEVADTIAWLCGPAASAVTGQAIVVAGGELA